MAFAIEADNAAEAAGSEHVGRLFRISVAMWANGLRLIDDGGTTVDELRYRARAACNIGGLERWGWISVGDGATKRRDGYGSHRGLRGATVLRPTRAGSYARRLWPRVVARVEERWQVRFGTELVGLLRDALAPYAGRMPWSPPEVHPSDGFYTHLFDGPTAADDDDHAPLVALLGQALTALTLEHEKDAEVSLPTAANLLRLIGDRVLRMRDLPLLSGVSKEAVAMAVNYLLRAHRAEPLPERSIALTVTGLDALDGYRARAARCRNEALQHALEGVVSQREAIAKGLVPPVGCWRGEKPYLAQTQRLLADPLGALPWHPMVLHRGGWPDGS